MAFEFDMSEFLKGIRDAHEKTRAAAIKAMTKFAADTVGLAAKYAPVGGAPHSPSDPDPGHLQESATWSDAVIDGDSISAQVGFNAFSAEGFNYGLLQHENLEFGHNVGGPKFLEKALREKAPKMEEFVGNEVKNEL